MATIIELLSVKPVAPVPPEESYDTGMDMWLFKTLVGAEDTDQV
jgi:hypothetical protein